MAFWEVPLAILSWLFLLLARLVSRGLVLCDSVLHLGRPLRWRLLSAETIGKPLALLVIMTTAPRWNPHAVIATLGPVRVRRSIRVESGAPASAVGTWTLVVYRFPVNSVVGSLNSRDMPSDGLGFTIDIESGVYTLALRYYRWSAEAELPTVFADNAEIAPAQQIPADLNDHLYQNLPQHANWLYLALHYHVYTMLRLHHWLPGAFVERELLPVGNPETRFSYGHLSAGCSLHLQAVESLLVGHDVYLTLYARNSFPLQWEQIATSEYTSESFDRDTFYVIRVHRNASLAIPLQPNDLSIAIRHPSIGRRR